MVKILMSTGTPSFAEQPTGEVARVLRELADRIDGHPNFSTGHSQPVLDADGIEIGSLDVI